MEIVIERRELLWVAHSSSSIRLIDLLLISTARPSVVHEVVVKIIMR